MHAVHKEDAARRRRRRKGGGRIGGGVADLHKATAAVAPLSHLHTMRKALSRGTLDAALRNAEEPHYFPVGGGQSGARSGGQVSAAPVDSWLSLRSSVPVFSHSDLCFYCVFVILFSLSACALYCTSTVQCVCVLQRHTSFWAPHAFVMHRRKSQSQVSQIQFIFAQSLTVTQLSTLLRPD